MHSARSHGTGASVDGVWGSRNALLGPTTPTGRAW